MLKKKKYTFEKTCVLKYKLIENIYIKNKITLFTIFSIIKLFIGKQIGKIVFFSFYLLTILRLN